MDRNPPVAELDAYDILIDLKHIARQSADTEAHRLPCEVSGFARLTISAPRQTGHLRFNDSPLFTAAKPVVVKPDNDDDQCLLHIPSGSFQVPLATLVRPVGKPHNWVQQFVPDFVVALSIELNDAKHQDVLASWLTPHPDPDSHFPTIMGRYVSGCAAAAQSSPQRLTADLAFEACDTSQRPAPSFNARLTFSMLLSRNLSVRKERYHPIKHGVYMEVGGCQETCPAELCFFCSSHYFSASERPKTPNEQSLMLLRHLQSQHKEIHIKKVETYGHDRVRVIYHRRGPNAMASTPRSSSAVKQDPDSRRASHFSSEQSSSEPSRLKSTSAASASLVGTAQKRHAEADITPRTAKTPRLADRVSPSSPTTPPTRGTPISTPKFRGAKSTFTVPRVSVQLFRQQTKQALQAGDVVDESDEDIDESWLQQDQARLMAEDGLSPAAVAFHTLFNQEVTKHGPLHNLYLKPFLSRFVKEHATPLKTTMRAPFKEKLLTLRRMNVLADSEIRQLVKRLMRAAGSADDQQDKDPAPPLESAEGDCERCHQDVEHPEDGLWCTGDACTTPVWHRSCAEHTGSGRTWQCANCRAKGTNGAQSRPAHLAPSSGVAT